ncbi:lysophospholipid acyltransferase family protein [Ignavigranum ruoffiae]|uniref:1-acyl-sn-glycerol-3-phosphate acyltransferase n=1 Tax=Ignavigranum ruoffiae TaxID=89093 RepID=A0A1H8ZUC3_9LACT|nr:1-acyl-sn-glycerol-3-phosphate acyltransferase [Ignavigranum ruoffiae]UPQ85653.1 1-acyl-sn-glycerol-3-phosphate acyltransferase [Ignavigranum ruoffiae]SEP67851.1 1-acyl-sn-glycerol-3-phosphate acyltransferase [Ignavigranum ruoffiae]
MYHFFITIISGLFKLLNGRPLIQGLENIPKDDSVIFAATHRSATDPFYLAINLKDRTIAFMAKESIFKFKPLAALLKSAHVFPVNRDKPSTKVIKHSVKLLADGLDLGIFPTGSRYSTEVKGGTAFIQTLSHKAIIPVSIQPPSNFWQFISRRKARIAFGPAIPYIEGKKYKKADLAAIDQQIAEEFDRLDKLNNPDYKYIPKKKKTM